VAPHNEARQDLRLLRRQAHLHLEPAAGRLWDIMPLSHRRLKVLRASMRLMRRGRYAWPWAAGLLERSNGLRAYRYEMRGIFSDHRFAGLLGQQTHHRSLLRVQHYGTASVLLDLLGMKNTIVRSCFFMLLDFVTKV
jgi:hypothetical protein